MNKIILLSLLLIVNNSYTMLAKLVIDIPPTETREIDIRSACRILGVHRGTHIKTVVEKYDRLMQEARNQIDRDMLTAAFIEVNRHADLRAIRLYNRELPRRR